MNERVSKLNQTPTGTEVGSESRVTNERIQSFGDTSSRNVKFNTTFHGINLPDMNEKVVEP